jgi:hypothetical protein
VVKAIATIPPKLLRAILPSIVTITLADPEMPVFYTGSTVMDPGRLETAFILSRICPETVERMYAV